MRKERRRPRSNEDDGTSPAYRNGVSRRTEIGYQRSAAGGEVNVSAPVGTYQPGPRRLEFRINPEASAREGFADDGRAHKVRIH
jgi:hypothetical protein